MTDLDRLGEELRSELGSPPASWTQRQRLRLRGLDVEPQEQSRSKLLVAALAACSLLAFGAYHLASAKTDSATARDERARPAQEERTRGEDLWVQAGAEATRHRLKDGSQIALEPGARGRLDESKGLGTRFDLHEGSASFDVVKQEGTSFSVVAGQFRVVVVGTRFSTAYIPPSQLTVTVDEGVVEVHLPGRASPVSVDSGETLAINGREFSLTEGPESASVGSEKPGEEVNKNLAPETKGSSTASWQQLYRDGKYERACEEARGQSIPGLAGRLGAAELIDLASALRLCGDGQGAMTTLDAVRRRFPGSSQAHDALFLIGRIHATSGQSTSAIASFDQYLAGASHGRFTAEAVGRLIELHKATGNAAKARKYAQQYLQMAPQGPYRRLAESVAKGP